MGTLRPLIAQTPLPSATKAYGQLLRRDLNPLDQSPITAYGQNLIIAIKDFFIPKSRFEPNSSLFPGLSPGQTLAHSFALRLPCLRHTSFRRSLTVPPPAKLDLRTCSSANTFVKMFNTLTEFTYRGLSPHKPFGLETCRRAHVESLRAERFTAPR
jgi:hypothetical protein